MVFGFRGASLLNKAVSTWAFRVAFSSEYSYFFGLGSNLYGIILGRVIDNYRSNHLLGMIFGFLNLVYMGLDAKEL